MVQRVSTRVAVILAVLAFVVIVAAFLLLSADMEHANEVTEELQHARATIAAFERRPSPGTATGVTGTFAVTTTDVATATLVATAPTTATVSAKDPEAAPTAIAIEGPPALREAEISGMAWFSDTLVFLPQYPGRFGYDGTVVTATTTGDGTLFGVRRTDIEAALKRDAPTVAPFAIPLAGAGFGDGEARSIDGFEGFEAVAFVGRSAYLSIEVQNGDDMRAYLVRGTVDVDADGRPIGITIDAGDPVPVPLPVEIDNMSIETLVADADGVMAIFEANGQVVNPLPKGYRFAFDLQPDGEVTFPTIEYRVTDASDVAADGSFWVTNYMFPGDAEALKPSADAIAARWGEGTTHASFNQVERIVRIERFPPRNGDKIGYALADQPPVQLALVDAATSRNWEGLVTLGDAGFLVVTDKFPSTIFAFVPAPATDSFP